MKLFLTSSTITDNLAGSFENLTERDIKHQKCAFIVDAMYSPKNTISKEQAEKYIEMDTQSLRNNYKWEVDIIELARGYSEDISKYDVIYVNGGLGVYLLEQIRKTGFEADLKQAIEHGMPYIGSSVGSMICSKQLDTMSWFIGEEEPEAKDLEGFGYIDFQIYPHYEPQLLPQIKEHISPKLKYVLLPDGCAISVDQQNVQHHGDGIEIIS